MKQMSFCSFLFLTLIFFVNILHADGFVAGTLVHTEDGLIPIEYCTVGDLILNKQALTTCPISHIISYAANHFVNITIDDECVGISASQRLYAINKNGWVYASILEVSDQLLCGNGEIVVIKKIETIQESQKIYALSIKTDHTFCVGRYGIVVHNVEPVATTAAAIAMSIVCPPAGAAIAIGEIIALGAVGIGMYCMHKKIQKQRKEKEGCFSDNSSINKSPDCAMPRIPVEEHAVCKIPINSTDELNEIIPYKKSEELDVGCALLIEVPKDTYVHQHDAKKDDCREEDQYTGPWYNRTEDWINEHPFGQKIKKSLERSRYTNQGKRAFKVIENIQNCDGFKKSDYVVVDAMHKDHLEVFDKRGRWVRVANFNGTKNNEKTKQGEKEFRGPLE